MTLGRYFPTFSAAFVLSYAVTDFFNLAMFTYLPAAHKFYWFVPAVAHTIGALPMFWYGWIVTALIPALGITALNASVPALKDKSVWPPLVWISPLVAFAVIVYVLRIWFVMP